MNGWRKLRLRAGWSHGGIPVQYRLGAGGVSVDLKGIAVRKETDPTDEDMARPLCKVPKELDRFRGETIVKWTRFSAHQEDRLVDVKIDEAGLLRVVPHDRRKRRKDV